MSFFNSKKARSAHKRPTSDSGVTILTSGCHFAGKLYCKGSSRMGGKIEGEIISEGVLIIEEGAVINADVKAEDTILHGKFNGRLVATGKVELTETSVFDGEVQTPSLIINEGAQFNGRITMPQPDKSNFVGIDELHKKKAAKDKLSELSVSN